MKKLPKDVVLRKRTIIKNKKVKQEIIPNHLTYSASTTLGTVTSAGGLPLISGTYVIPQPILNLDQATIDSLKEIVNIYKDSKKADLELYEKYKKEGKTIMLKEIVKRFDSCQKITEWYRIVAELREVLKELESE